MCIRDPFTPWASVLLLPGDVVDDVGLQEKVSAREQVLRDEVLIGPHRHTVTHTQGTQHTQTHTYTHTHEFIHHSSYSDFHCVTISPQYKAADSH